MPLRTQTGYCSNCMTQRAFCLYCLFLILNILTIDTKEKKIIFNHSNYYDYSIDTSFLFQFAVAGLVHHIAWICVVNLINIVCLAVQWFELFRFLSEQIEVMPRTAYHVYEIPNRLGIYLSAFFVIDFEN